MIECFSTLIIAGDCGKAKAGIDAALTGEVDGCMYAESSCFNNPCPNAKRCGARATYDRYQAKAHILSGSIL